MLPHAKYRHSDYYTAAHAGVAGVTAPNGRGLHHPPNQTTRHPILKSFFNQTCDRYQNVYGTTCPACRTAEDTCELCLGLHIYFGQYPPPLQKSGASPPSLIRTKDPPPKHMVNSLLCRGLLSHLMRPDINAHSHRSDRLTLASEHPPPKGQVTVNRARWKVNWQQPPPTTRGAAWHTVTPDTSLRHTSSQMMAKSITAQGDRTFFSIEAGTEPYYLKFLHRMRPDRELKPLHCSFSFVLSVLLVTIKAIISRAIYSGRKFAYSTGLEDGSMLTSPINQNRQILPSYTEFNDHVCLVGNICLVNKGRTRKRYSH